MAGSEGTDHRKSLVAITSLAVVLQLGWIDPTNATSSVLGWKIDPNHAKWIVGFGFLYFFILYHQHWWKVAGYRTPWSAAITRIHSRLHNFALQDPDAKGKIVHVEQPLLRLTQWRIRLHDQEGKGDPKIIHVSNPLWLKSTAAWLHSIFVVPADEADWFATLWSLVPIVLLIPAVRTWAQGMFG